MKNNITELANILQQAILTKDVSGIRILIVEFNVVDFSEAIAKFKIKDILFVIRALQTGKAAEVFAHLDSDIQEELVELWSSKEIQGILKELFTDDIVDLVDELPANLINKVLKATSNERRKEINKILNYVDFTAGSVMTTEYVYAYTASTVKEAILKIKSLGKKRIETYEFIYVLDRHKSLLGVVSLIDLMFASSNKKIKSIMTTNPVTIEDKADQEEAAELMKKYELAALPVVNFENKILGIITIDDILEIVEKEATEDIHKMAAINPTNDTYSNSSIISLFRSRVIWLLVLMITATITQVVIENGIPKVDIILLASLIPLMMDTAGNAGGQSGAVIIRALSTGDIETKDYWNVIFKELIIAIMIGVVIFIANYIRMLWLGNASNISIITSLAVFITIVVAKLLGGSLPIIAVKLKMDPAVVAAPLITTIVDLLAILILFNVYRFLI